MSIKRLIASILVPIVIIVLMCSVLIVSHMITADLAAEKEEESQMAQLKELLPASDEFLLLESNRYINGIKSVYYAANKSGCVIDAESATRSGTVEVLVSIGINGSIVRVDVLDAAEEASTLAFMLKENRYTDQYIGASAVTEDITLPGKLINGIEGADASSEAVFNCVSTALSQFSLIQDYIRSVENE